MKHPLLVLLLAALLPMTAASGKDSTTDPLAGAFFPPELVFLARDQIGLTQKQENVFRDRVEKMQIHSEELRVKLERETAALAALANQEHVDEAAIIAQLDKVLDAEREVKHLHVGLGVAIKNLLTPEQQAKLREIAKGVGKGSVAFRQLEEATSKRFAEKIERVKAGVERWQADGRDPSSIAQAMEEKFKPLIDAGKVMEAEAELDRLLEQLKPDAK
jgi:periplasmic protein CpxP/Spy